MQRITKPREEEHYLVGKPTRQTIIEGAQYVRLSDAVLALSNQRIDELIKNASNSELRDIVRKVVDEQDDRGVLPF